MFQLNNHKLLFFILFVYCHLWSCFCSCFFQSFIKDPYINAEVSPVSIESSGEIRSSSPKGASVDVKNSLVQSKIKDFFGVVNIQTSFKQIHWSTFHAVVIGVTKILKKTKKPLKQTLIRDFFPNVCDC